MSRRRHIASLVAGAFSAALTVLPGDFAGATYDPATCVTTPVATDAGSDGPD